MTHTIISVARSLNAKQAANGGFVMFLAGIEQPVFLSETVFANALSQQGIVYSPEYMSVLAGAQIAGELEHRQVGDLYDGGVVESEHYSMLFSFNQDMVDFLSSPLVDQRLDKLAKMNARFAPAQPKRKPAPLHEIVQPVVGIPE